MRRLKQGAEPPPNFFKEAKHIAQPSFIKAAEWHGEAGLFCCRKPASITSLMDNDKIPGGLRDQVKLCTYLSPGDLRLLWTAFKSVCNDFRPGQPGSVTQPITNLRDFWKTILDRSAEAAEAGEYPLECTITFCRGDFLAIVSAINKSLMCLDKNAESAKKALVLLREFFLDRLYDPAREQGIGAPFRRKGALLNDLYAGRSMIPGMRNLPSPKPQRIILLAAILALLVPSERQSLTSVADYMARMFGWKPMRTLEEMKHLLELSRQDPDYRLYWHKDESGLIHVILPKKVDYGTELREFMPSPPFRDIIAFAVAMAFLVPDENRRRALAMQGIALLTHDLFGWSTEQAAQEIDLCAKFGLRIGIGPSF